MSASAVLLRRSIRFRLSLVIAVVIFAAVMSASTAGAFRDLRRAADARAEMIEAAASAYAAALADPLASNDRRAALDYMRGMRDLRSVVFMALEDRDGAVLAELGAGASARGKSASLRALAGLDPLNGDLGFVTMPVTKGGIEIGSLYVLGDITDLRADLFATLGWATLVGLVAIGGGVAAAQLTINQITRALRELAAVMTGVGASQDLSQRAEPSQRQDETAMLVEAFNGMLDSIQAHDQRIAHQVETLELTLGERTHDLRLAREDAEAANARLVEALKHAGSGSAAVQPVPAAAPAAPPGPSPETPLIDEEAVANKAAFGARSGGDGVARAWRLFLGQAPDAVFRLETLAAGGDPAALAKQVNFLKSMALSAGASRLVALCDEIERQGKTAGMDAARAPVSRVRPALELTCAEMTTRLADRAASAS